MSEKKSIHLTAFYVETLVMVIAFACVLLILTQIMGTSRKQSSRARHLNEGVRLAQEAAEALSYARSPDELGELLGQDGQAEKLDRDVLTYRTYFDENGLPAVDDWYYSVDTTWEPDADSRRFINSTITVNHKGENAPVYELTTGVYVREVRR